MTLTIDVLGPLMIRADGHAARKLPRKASALVVFLMVSGQPVPRARLADLLWPYQGSEQARHSLRNCLLELRKVTNAHCRSFNSDFANCSIGEDVAGDIHRFIPLARSPAGSPHEFTDLRAACELYRGEFLDGFQIASEPWNEWADSAREDLKNLATGALLRLSQLSSAAGQHDEAIGAARRLIHLDPLIERFHQQLMRALAAGGRGSEAAQQYKRLATMLRVELAVCPDIDSQHLLREITAGRRAPEPPRKPIERPLGVRPASPYPSAGIDPRPTLALKAPVPAWSDADDLTELLHRLGTAMAGSEPGKGGLTIGMVKQAGTAMLAAADDRRRDVEGRLPELEYAVQVPAPLCERIAA
jgi:DNA-binding SARP family transcriptional activator